MQNSIVFQFCGLLKVWHKTSVFTLPENEIKQVAGWQAQDVRVHAARERDQTGGRLAGTRCPCSRCPRTRSNRWRAGRHKMSVFTLPENEIKQVAGWQAQDVRIHTTRERDQDVRVHAARERDQDVRVHAARDRDQDVRVHTARERDQDVRVHTARGTRSNRWQAAIRQFSL